MRNTFDKDFRKWAKKKPELIDKAIDEVVESQKKCSYCGEKLQENIVVVGFYGLPQLAKFYCRNHGIYYKRT